MDSKIRTFLETLFKYLALEGKHILSFKQSDRYCTRKNYSDVDEIRVFDSQNLNGENCYLFVIAPTRNGHWNIDSQMKNTWLTQQWYTHIM